MSRPRIIILIVALLSSRLSRYNSGRRTFITRLANKGVGVRVLAALAGHSSIAVTQRYIDVNDAQLANAVELL
jgi:integrase/recombinase XerD